MTDRISAFIVVLDQPIRDDDTDEIKTALGMVKHVIDVQPHVQDATEVVAVQRARHELGTSVLRAVSAAVYPGGAT